MKRTLGRKIKFSFATIAVACSIAISVPFTATAEEEPIAPTSSQIQNPGEEGHEERERGLRIDRDFDASHPSEWIAIGLAIALAISLAYTVKLRKRNRN